MSFHDIIFKQINLEKNFSSQKTKWQITVDNIASGHQEEIKRSKFKIITNSLETSRKLKNTNK